MTLPRIAAALSLSLLLAACDFDVPDLNRPGLDQILTNPTPATVEAAATGLVQGARADIAERIGYVSELGILGRESYVLSGSDDRFVTQLLSGAPLDPGTSNFGGNFWVAPYANIRNAYLVLDALPKMTGSLTDQDKESIRGFAKTMMALDFLKVINTRDVNGAAIDVDLPIGQLAPLVSKDEVFVRIASLLEEAKKHLQGASAAFPFPLGSGFASFAAPADFLKFNRALAARVAVYRGQYASALTMLGESFLDIAAPLSLGAYHPFGIGSGDVTNDLNTTDIFVHPSVVTDAEPLSPAPAGCSGLTCLDNRVQAKVTPYLDPTGAASTQTLYGLTSGYNFKLYPNKDSPVPIIRNEELILLRAEANIGLANAAGGTSAQFLAAKKDIDFIRVNSGGLAPRCPSLGSGGCTGAPLANSNILDELLKQKRYSLLFEGGHRWIDARRYGKLGTLPIDVPGQAVQPNFPIPSAETDARH